MQRVEVRNFRPGFEISAWGKNATVKGISWNSGEYCTIFLTMKDGQDRVAHWKPRTKIPVYNI